MKFFGWIALGIVASFQATAQDYVTRANTTCAHMATLADALYYLRQGARQLDDDNDGKPCEAKFAQ